MPAASYLTTASAQSNAAPTSFLKRKFFSLSSKSRTGSSPSGKRTAGPYGNNPAQWTASRSEMNAAAVEPRTAVEETTQELGALSFATEPIRRAYNYVKEKLNSKSPLDLLPQSWRDYVELYRSVSRTFLSPATRLLAPSVLFTL